ncbi:hypothetical protein [Georgenia thermotolerans]|uniref:Uncharacterized protein n=1 Tax=Georgenia thermotolerans TaxID=527326 RepID=A0A7J5UPQ4_9MICO|nr:hypothetical protein [Georgenia thermotolerans]KAE8764396.1 hypothetical protein GB883_09260 [Georgenia thermotolerans]
MTRLLAALRAAFGASKGDAAEEQPQGAAPSGTRARHRAEPSVDAPRRAEDYVPAGRHRAPTPA